jgi:hypothetical protein
MNNNTGNKLKKSSNDIYYTPKPVALKMIEMCDLKPNNKVLDERFNKDISDIKIRISRMEALFIDIKKIFVNTSIMYIKENLENISKNLVVLRHMIIDREIDNAIIECKEIRKKLDDEYESLERVGVIQNEISSSNSRAAHDSNLLTLKRKRD